MIASLPVSNRMVGPWETSLAQPRRGQMSGSISELPTVGQEPRNGTRRRIGDKECVYYDGYWIRYYPPPTETLEEKKKLIDLLTRRLFHHTELGINTPSDKLDVARVAHERETDPRRKRVCGAMLAGALFNRATEIFTTIVELAAKGVETSPDNELMRECEACFVEALELGKSVKHYSGHEGIDELWGEPLKAFSTSMMDCYTGRYAKIAQTMRDIDRIADALIEVIEQDERLGGAKPLVRAFARAAKEETETMRTDDATFDVWPEFVACGERLLEFRPRVLGTRHQEPQRPTEEAMQVIREGKEILTYLAGARVPMPKSTREVLEMCGSFRNPGRATAQNTDGSNVKTQLSIERNRS